MYSSSWLLVQGEHLKYNDHGQLAFSAEQSSSSLLLPTTASHCTMAQSFLPHSIYFELLSATSLTQLYAESFLGLSSALVWVPTLPETIKICTRFWFFLLLLLLLLFFVSLFASAHLLQISTTPNPHAPPIASFYNIHLRSWAISRWGQHKEIPTLTGTGWRFKLLLGSLSTEIMHSVENTLIYQHY